MSTTTSSRPTAHVATFGVCCHLVKWSPKARDRYAYPSGCAAGTAVRSGTYRSARPCRPARWADGSCRPETKTPARGRGVIARRFCSAKDTHHCPLAVQQIGNECCISVPSADTACIEHRRTHNRPDSGPTLLALPPKPGAACHRSVQGRRCRSGPAGRRSEWLGNHPRVVRLPRLAHCRNRQRPPQVPQSSIMLS